MAVQEKDTREEATHKTTAETTQGNYQPLHCTINSKILK